MGTYHFWSTGCREVLLMLTIKKVKLTINYFYCFIHIEFTEHDLYVNENCKDSALRPVTRNNVWCSRFLLKIPFVLFSLESLKILGTSIALWSSLPIFPFIMFIYPHRMLIFEMFGERCSIELCWNGNVPPMNCPSQWPHMCEHFIVQV